MTQTTEGTGPGSVDRVKSRILNGDVKNSNLENIWHLRKCFKIKKNNLVFNIHEGKRQPRPFYKKEFWKSRKEIKKRRKKKR